MQNKTEIMCNVASCVFYKGDRCHAETISVSCDNCVNPKACHETECSSFRCKNMQTDCKKKGNHPFFFLNFFRPFHKKMA